MRFVWILACCYLICAGPASSQFPDSLGRGELGSVAGFGAAIVTSDIVGPDSPEGSHQRTTLSPAFVVGLDAGYAIVATESYRLSLRLRLVGTVASMSTAVVHQHEDVIPGAGGPDVLVLTDHGVRHTVQRVDLHVGIAIEHHSVPVRLVLAGGTSLAIRNTVDATFHEQSRTELPKAPRFWHDEDLTIATSFVRRRTSVVGILEYPLRYGRLVVTPALGIDLGVHHTIGDNVPYSDHTVSATVGLAWQL